MFASARPQRHHDVIRMLETLIVATNGRDGAEGLLLVRGWRSALQNN